MKTKGLIGTIVLIALFGFVSPAFATSLRCGVRLITVGDPKSKVLAECGDPDYVQVWEEERVYRFHHHPSFYGIYENYDYERRDNEYGKPYRIRKLVVVEEWTYNHGPSRFMDHLQLENGVVRKISSGGYGY